jgi:putative transposase
MICQTMTVTRYSRSSCGISRPTFYLWKQKFGEAGVPELQRLKALEQENAKLKRMYADQALELVAIKDVLTRKL